MKTGDVEDAALRFIEAVFKLPEGAANDEPEPWPTYWQDNGRTVPPYVQMTPGEPISCNDLGTLSVATLVVQGATTYPYYSMLSERLAACQGNALLVTMPEANHDGPYRRSDQFANLIQHFIALVE